MKQYKYPVKYFCGAGAQIYAPEVFADKVKAVDEQLKMNVPITGETGIDGVLLDFNYGLRLQIPEGNWHVKIIDAESGYVFIDEDIAAVTLLSIEKYWIDWEIAIWKDGEPIFYHRFDPRGQKVHFKFPKATLGDNIAMLPYVEEFRRQFDCEVSCSIADTFRDIVKNYYPNVRLTKTLPDDTYACFFLQMISNISFAAVQDTLNIPMLRAGNAILRRVRHPSKVIYTPTKPRAISAKYVCIGVQASTNDKCWLAPGGWDEVVAYLKSLGYRVLCIDRDRVCSNSGMTVKMPRGAEDFSGKYKLQDRINQLAYADFFIGVSSGLSWLAWAVDIPVIMISGLTAPWYEFETPYRINNPIVCHGCFNVLTHYVKLPKCPMFDGTERAYECSKEISARQVINAIERLLVERKQSGGS